MPYLHVKEDAGRACPLNGDSRQYTAPYLCGCQNTRAKSLSTIWICQSYGYCSLQFHRLHIFRLYPFPLLMLPSLSLEFRGKRTSHFRYIVRYKTLSIQIPGCATSSTIGVSAIGPLAAKVKSNASTCERSVVILSVFWAGFTACLGLYIALPRLETCHSCNTGVLPLVVQVAGLNESQHVRLCLYLCSLDTSCNSPDT